MQAPTIAPDQEETSTTERSVTASRTGKAGLGRVSEALKRNRRGVAAALMASIAEWEKFAPSVGSMGAEAFMNWETVPLADYLINYIDKDETVWRDLYVGERLKQLNWPADTLPEMLERYRTVFTADRDALVGLLKADRSGLSKDELDAFAGRIDWMKDLVTSTGESGREVKILLVGDCLFLDLCTFLTVPLLEEGMTLRPTYATSKNPIELRSSLRAVKNEKFDLILYSPYTYEFSLLLSQTHYLKGMFSGSAAIKKLAAEAHRQIVPTLKLLTEEFDCNVFVQNTANVRRHNSTFDSYLKNFATARARKAAAKEVNALLVQEIADRNLVAAKPVVMIDELPLAKQYGELALSRKFYDSEPVHPTEMALRLSEIYREIAVAAKLLLTKKVVVLDLDNTLWDGVIGEGAVQNFHRRQDVLKLLRNKGVLLTIASKNDPKNVHWTDATLNEKDFVASQINWDPKSTSIKRIAETLNLKVKDFVFIDDRPDEREMVRMTIPGILCLDATEEATWRKLDWWAEALPEQNEGDRTQMYLERQARQSHLDEAAEKEDQQKLLASLGIKIDLYPAKTKDLARAAELINRTNQFNTCGSRVSNQQVAAWSESANHFILVAEATDKFGAMGIISVMVVEQVGDALVVPIWVLSCRVFGFGIESAMLGYVADLARKLEVGVVRGLIVETSNNQPCRAVYASNGFVAGDAGWEASAMVTPVVPGWLAVSSVEVRRPVLR